MTNIRMAWLTLGIGGLLLTGGCHTLRGCSNPETYSTSEELPPLKIPVGLDAPDTEQALQIPALSAPQAPPTAANACLEEPPPMREPGSQSEPIRDAPASSKSTQPERKGPISPPR